MDQANYDKQLVALLRETASSRPEFEGRYFKWPILNEDTQTTSFDTHYIYHVAWALRKVKNLAPDCHVDFSSSLCFCTACCSFVKTKFFDFRPAQLFLEDLECGQCDLSASDFNVGQFPSVSCMHVVEHIGLGRYGDNLDANGDLKAIENLKKSVLPGGDLLFVVPCGRSSIMFNAHRIYSAQNILDYMGKAFQLLEFYFITGNINDKPLTNPDLSIVSRYNYGCGCFHFKRMS